MYVRFEITFYEPFLREKSKEMSKIAVPLSKNAFLNHNLALELTFIRPLNAKKDIGINDLDVNK